MASGMGSTVRVPDAVVIMPVRIFRETTVRSASHGVPPRVACGAGSSLCGRSAPSLLDCEGFGFRGFGAAGEMTIAGSDAVVCEHLAALRGWLGLRAKVEMDRLPCIAR